MYDEILKLIDGEFSASRALDHAIAIYRWDRTMDNRSFHRSAAYCADELRRAGLDDVKLIESPADGKTANGDLVMPKAWEIDEATLTIIQPPEAEMVLASFVEEPLSVSTFSAPTPPEGIEADVLLIDDLTGHDVKGAVVFGNNGGQIAKPLESGAAGYITSSISAEPHVRDSNDIPDARGWDHAYSLQPANEGRKFGFVISPRQRRWLEDLITRCQRDGKRVRVRAVVKSRLYDGSVPMVTATIRGSTEPEKEVILDSHLYEPGALDNASGCGILLESARVLMKLISEGKLPPPGRTIRFFFGMEFHSISAYVTANLKAIRNVVGAFYVDSLGGSPQKTRAPYLLIQNHDAIASYTDVLLEDITRKRFEKGNPYLNLIIRPFWGNDPAVANDPLIGMQMTSLIQHPNKFYHTSQDTPDLLTKEDFKAVGPIPATFAYFVANMSLLDAVWLTAKVESDGRCQLEKEGAEATKATLTAVASVQPSIPDAIAKSLASSDEKMRYVGERAVHTLRSIPLPIDRDDRDQVTELISAAEAEMRGRCDELLSRIRDLASVARTAYPEDVVLDKEIELKGEELEASKMVAQKVVPGLLTFRNLTEAERTELNESYKHPNAMYWVDGRRTVLEIARLHRLMTGQGSVAELVRQFRALSKFGYVTLNDGNAEE